MLLSYHLPILITFQPGYEEAGFERRLEETACYVTLTEYQWGEQIKKNQMGGTYSTCGGQRDSRNILVQNQKERNNLIKMGIEGRIILK